LQPGILATITTMHMARSGLTDKQQL